jgi:predicted transcriptional regulator
MASYTSAEAAKAIADQVESLRQQIYTLIASHPDGLTCDEVEVLLKMRHQTASARIRELIQQKRLRFKGTYRATRSGRKAWIYKVNTEA